jgi:hypothetical protein
MSSQVHVGLAVTAHDNSAVSTVRFDGVRVVYTRSLLEIHEQTLSDVPSSPSAEDCDDGQDNDCDGLVD